MLTDIKKAALAAFTKSYKSGGTVVDSELAKTINVATGLVVYDLEPGAKLLAPELAVNSPLRTAIPRVSGKGGTGPNWKVITSTGSQRATIGVSEGRRGAGFTPVKQDYFAAYKGIGEDDHVTFEAVYAAGGDYDPRAFQAARLLDSMTIQEERTILGGNATLALGVTPTPTLTNQAAGTGTLPATAIGVICVALTLDGLRMSDMVLGVGTTTNRTNGDGTSDTISLGSASKSAAAPVTPAANGSVFAQVAPVRGAFGYAWYWGAAGNELLGAITTISATVISAPATGTQNASAIIADNSRDVLIFDGLATQLWQPGSGAYIRMLPIVNGQGTALATGAAGGVDVIDEMFDSMWNTSRLGPTSLWMSSRTKRAVDKALFAAGGVGLVRNETSTGGNTDLTAGYAFSHVINPNTNQKVALRVHPHMPDGWIKGYSSSVPYKLSDVPNLVQMKTRQEYYSIEWPQRTRRYEFGVYADEVLQNYYPAAFALVGNVKFT